MDRIEDNSSTRTRGPQVWVPYYDGRLDLSDAERFGSIIVISRRDVYPDDADERMPEVAAEATSFLRHFDPRQDYLCLVGSPVHLATCCLVLGSQVHRPIRMLRYDRMERRYCVITADIEENIDERAGSVRQTA